MKPFLESRLSRLRAIPPRELRLLVAAVALGVAIRVIYVLATRHVGFVGDAAEYDAEGRFIAGGHWFWTTLPFGHAHPSAWKAPGYPAWVGAWYAVVGAHPAVVRLAQVLLCGPATIVLTWMLGRRLFGPRVGLAAAFVVAVYPFAWQYEGLFYPESLATPLTVATLLVFLGRPPTARRWILAGLLVGAGLYLRPTSFYLLAAIVVAAWLGAGLRRGTAYGVATIVAAVLVVVPWTIRNENVLHGFVPISIQDAAAYGTFNRDAASDPVYPYAWRPAPASDLDLLPPRSKPVSDVTFRSRLIKRARSYISDHPSSVLAAFYWNGLSRLWDVRRPSHALAEVPFEGRSRTVTWLGLLMYYVLLPLALIGLWLARRRRDLLLPIGALALGASVVFTIAAETRYRAPLEPLIAILACSALVAWRERRVARVGP